MRLFYDNYNKEENIVEAIAIKCIDFHRSTGLYLKDKTVQEMTTQFVLNIVLPHVGVSWIIYSKKKMK